MSNSSGTPISRDLMMRQYDSCPPDVRAMLRERVTQWHVADVMKGLKLVFPSMRSRARALAYIEGELKKLEAQNTYRTYGPDHPQACAHGKRLRPDHNRIWSAGGRG